MVFIREQTWIEYYAFFLVIFFTGIHFQVLQIGFLLKNFYNLVKMSAIEIGLNQCILTKLRMQSFKMKKKVFSCHCSYCVLSNNNMVFNRDQTWVESYAYFLVIFLPWFTFKYHRLFFFLKNFYKSVKILAIESGFDQCILTKLRMQNYIVYAARHA